MESATANNCVYMLLSILLLIITSVNAEELDDIVHADKQKKNFLNSNYIFSNVSFNYLDWTSGTEKRSGKADFIYLEFEGGAGWDWGDFYFFTDLENPEESWTNTSPDNMRFVFKPKLNIKLADSNWLLHIQNYYLKEDDFYVNNFVPGIAYNFITDSGLWFQPFFGGHYQNSTFYSGWNGYMTGWLFNYDFLVKKQKFAVSQWHEYEFDRDKEHYQLDDGTRIGDGSSSGTNGAIALWWHINKKITTGIQYRYADKKLGSYRYQAGPIYTLKYNF